MIHEITLKCGSAAAALLHPLEAELEVDGLGDAALLVGLQGVYPAQHRPLVVCGPPPIQLTSLHSQYEGLRVPAVLLETTMSLNVCYSLQIQSTPTPSDDQTPAPLLIPGTRYWLIPVPGTGPD